MSKKIIAILSTITILSLGQSASASLYNEDDDIFERKPSFTLATLAMGTGLAAVYVAARLTFELPTPENIQKLGRVKRLFQYILMISPKSRFARFRAYFPTAFILFVMGAGFSVNEYRNWWKQIGKEKYTPLLQRYGLLKGA